MKKPRYIRRVVQADKSAILTSPKKARFRFRESQKISTLELLLAFAESRGLLAPKAKRKDSVGDPSDGEEEE